MTAGVAVYTVTSKDDINQVLPKLFGLWPSKNKVQL